MRCFKYLLFAFILISMTTTPNTLLNMIIRFIKPLYLNEAFRLMDSMQNFLLLDVRSPGRICRHLKSYLSRYRKNQGFS